MSPAFASKALHVLCETPPLIRTAQGGEENGDWLRSAQRVVPVPAFLGGSGKDFEMPAQNARIDSREDGTRARDAFLGEYSSQ